MSSPAIVLLHGLLLPPAMWDSVASLLAPRRVVAARIVADTFDGLVAAASVLAPALGRPVEGRVFRALTRAACK